MSVYLVYREPYNWENCKVVKKYPFDLLSWAQQAWEIVTKSESEKQAYINLHKYLGVNIYGTWFYSIFDMEIEKPRTIEEVFRLFTEVGYINQVSSNNRNFIQVLTDDDELELSYYIFYDTYLFEKKGFTSYLTTDTFDLPIASPDFASNSFNDKGLWLCFENHFHKQALSEIEPNIFLSNIELEGLSQYLAFAKVNHTWRLELLILRAFSVNRKMNPKSFDQMMQDFLSYDFTFWEEFMKTYEGEERAFLLQDDILAVQKELEDKYQSFVPKRLFNKGHGMHRIQRASNLFQVGIFNEDWETNPMFATSPCYVYDHWIFFESSWAEEYPDLANSIDRYFTRWDCLE